MYAVQLVVLTMSIIVSLCRYIGNPHNRPGEAAQRVVFLAVLAPASSLELTAAWPLTHGHVRQSEIQESVLCMIGILYRVSSSIIILRD